MKVQRRRFLADLMKDEEKDKRPQSGATLAAADNSRAGTPLASGCKFVPGASGSAG